MPTLCWIAPEMPAARYSFGATVLPVWPIWPAYGNQPASTTARVAATAPPSAAASSLELLEAVGVAEAAAARHEHVGVLDVDVGAALLAALDHRGLQRVRRELDLHVLDRRRAGAGLADLERVQAPDDHADLRPEADVGDLRVLEDRPLGDELAVLDARPP